MRLWLNNRVPLRGFLLVVGLCIPVGALASTAARSGMMYTFSESEIWGCNLQARNLLAGKASQTFLLTDDSSTPEEVRGGRRIYVHGPWLLPRLGPLLLICLGVRGLFLQNFLVCLALYGAYALLLSRTITLRSWPAILFLFVLHLDYFGFLRPMMNMARVWHFPMLGFCLLALFGRPAYPLLTAVAAFFVLWEQDVLFAVFGTASCAAIWALQRVMRLHSPAWGRVGLGAGLGVACAVGLFVAQLVMYYGPGALWEDLTKTITARNTHGLEAEPSTFAQILRAYSVRNREWHLPQTTYQLGRHLAGALVAHYGWPLVCLGGLGAVAALIVAARARRSAPDGPPAADREAVQFLALLLLGSLFGLLVCSLLLRGQTYMIGLFHFHPMLVFIVAPAFALGCCALLELAQRALRSAPAAVWSARVAVPVLALAFLVSRSDFLHKTYPPLNTEPFFLLASPEFQGKQVFYATGYPDDGERSCLVIQNATGVPPRSCHQPDRLFDDPTPAEYVLYLRHWFWAPNHRLSVDQVEQRFAANGYEAIATGKNYVLMKLAPARWAELQASRPSPE